MPAKQSAKLTQKDLQDALNAAHSIGDDTIQKQSRGYVTPDGFSHGTSQQRMKWFSTGFKTGDINQCDTFNVRNP